MTPSQLLLPTYRQMLGVLDAWLAKAAAASGDDNSDAADALMAARLAPDMFPLATQVRFACVQALEGVHRAQGSAFPPAVAEMLAEGRDAGETPGTLTQARARIAQTLAALAQVDPATLDGDEDAAMEHALPMGIVFDFDARTYLRDWALPQFFFHVMTAYAILRAQGVPLGKGDYVGHLMAHVRPGTMPGSAPS